MRLFAFALALLPSVALSQPVGPVDHREIPTAPLLGGSGSKIMGVTLPSASFTISGGALTPVFGAAAGNFAQGSDARITGALQSASNLSDLASAATARTNLGLGTLSTLNAAPAGTLTGSALASGVTSSSLTSLAGGVVGTAAYVNTGTSGATIPLLNGSNTWSGAQTHTAALNFSGTGASLVVPNLTATPLTAGSVAYNTGTGRYDFGIGASVVNHVRLSGDTMTGALHMGANTIDGSAIAFTGGSLSGVTFSGGTLSGTISGSPTLSGALTLSGAGTALSVANNATIGGTLNVTGQLTLGNAQINVPGLTIQTNSGTQKIAVNAGGNGTVLEMNGISSTAANHLTITAGATGNAATLGTAGSDTNRSIALTPAGTGIVFSAGAIQSPTFQSGGGTTTLSGSTVPAFQGYFLRNWTGTSTIVGNTSLANVWIGDSSDNATISNSTGARNELLIYGGYGGTGFTGARQGAWVQMALNVASTLNAPQDGLLGYGAVVTANVNAGGSGTGFGTTNFGMGSLFGANPWCRLATGATYYRGCVGEEIDASIQTGASASYFAVQQLVLTADHAVHGQITDVMQSFSAQGGAAVGARNIITVGRYDSGGNLGTSSSLPLDPNGYIFQVQTPATGVPASAAFPGAGGFDLNQFQPTGNGVVGGGFAWRSPGVQLLDSAAQVNYLSIETGASGPVLNASYQKMTASAGSITVGAGGTNWNDNQLACDQYGDCVRVTQTGGVVTGVSAVVSRGWQKSPPANPVPFTGFTASGTNLGTGLTLNLTWAPESLLTLNAGGNTMIGSGTALANNATTGFLQIATMAGAPTGSVGATGQAAIVIDTTNKKLCYSIGGGTWECSAAFTP